MWWLTFNDNTCTIGRCTSFKTPDDGRLRPKHVEWLCRNKTCTVLHQVGVSFDLYYDARKHKIKKTAISFVLRQYGNNYPTRCHRIQFIYICRLLNMFRMVFHPSSGAHNTVCRLSGINDNCTPVSAQPRSRQVAVTVSLKTDTVDKVLWAPDDGWNITRNMLNSWQI